MAPWLISSILSTLLSLYAALDASSSDESKNYVDSKTLAKCHQMLAAMAVACRHLSPALNLFQRKRLTHADLSSSFHWCMQMSSNCVSSCMKRCQANQLLLQVLALTRLTDILTNAHKVVRCLAVSLSYSTYFDNLSDIVIASQIQNS